MVFLEENTFENRVLEIVLVKHVCPTPIKILHFLFEFN